MPLLLAEDEQELADWLYRALKQNGYIVDWVNDGRMVEPSIRQVKYDALILDLGLPGIDGHSVLARLRNISVNGCASAPMRAIWAGRSEALRPQTSAW